MANEFGKIGLYSILRNTNSNMQLCRSITNSMANQNFECIQDPWYYEKRKEISIDNFFKETNDVKSIEYRHNNHIFNIYSYCSYIIAEYLYYPIEGNYLVYSNLFKSFFNSSFINLLGFELDVFIDDLPLSVEYFKEKSNLPVYLNFPKFNSEEFFVLSNTRTKMNCYIEDVIKEQFNCNTFKQNSIEYIEDNIVKSFQL